MNVLRKSFKSQAAHNISPVWNQSDDQRPILEQSNDLQMKNNNKVWRESSYDFWKKEGEDQEDGSGFSFRNPGKNDSPEISEDPPSRLISSFLHKQKTSGSEIALDMDLEMEELNKQTKNSTSSSSKGQSDDEDDEHSEVLRCTSNSSFRRSKSLLRAKTRSRLLDPPPPARSGQIPNRSGLLAKSRLIEEDEEDPFEDLPDEFKRTKISKWTVFELIGLVLAIAALVCSLAMQKLARRTIWGLHLWKWEVLVLVLISGRLLSGWLIRIIVFFIERNFYLRKRFLYFVYGVRKAVQNCIWLGLVLLAWHFLFDKKVVGENMILSYITKILFCLIVATVLRLVKTLLVKVLASSFHVSTYFDRIQEALFNQYVIETLSGPPLLEIQHNREEEDRMMAEVQKLQNAGATIPKDLKLAAMSLKNGRVIGGSGGISHGGQIGKSTKFSGSVSKKNGNGNGNRQQGGGITIDELHKLNQKNISVWNMKRMMRTVRLSLLTTLDEQVVLGFEEDELSMHIKSEHEAKIAARKIFNNVAKPGAK